MDGACLVCFCCDVNVRIEFVRWKARVHRLDLGLHSHPKEFLGNGVKTRANSKGKISCTRKKFLRGGSNPRPCIKQDSEPNTLPTELFRPPGHSVQSVPSPPSHPSLWVCVCVEGAGGGGGGGGGGWYTMTCIYHTLY